ncbi:hypothetical protein V3N99_17470 [Dermatophilaceae bacterium Soc4.6]
MARSVRILHTYLDGVPIGEVRQNAQGALTSPDHDGYRSDPASTPLSLA